MGISRVPSFSNRPGFPAGLRILLVEPNDDDLKAIASQLRECNYQVSECTSEADASRMIDSCTEEFDLVICEASVVPNDPAASSAFARTASTVPLVLTGENTSQQQKLVGIRFGAMDFLEKPVALLKLRNVWQHTVRKMLKKQSSASLAEGDVSTGKKGRQAGCLPRSRTEDLCKHAAISESAQESTGSSQGDQMHCSKNTTDAPKSKNDRRISGELRAVRRSASGSVRSISVSKSVSTKSTPASAAPQPVTDQTSARGEASTEDATATQKRAEVVPTQQQHSQQQMQPLAAMPQHPPQGQMPDMSMAANGMTSPNGMLSYGLHGMPPPLPGCVWGLPMLPPPVPGLMGAPMMATPNSMMMPGSHQDPCSHMPWGQPVPNPGMHAMGHSVATTASSAPHSMPSRALSAPVPGTAIAVPVASAAGSGIAVVAAGAAGTSAGTLTPKASGSMATWSHDASAATNIGDMAWAEVDVDVDVFGLGNNTDDLHDFSDSLLQAGDGTEAVKSGTSRQAKRSSAGGEKLMDEEEELGAEGLSWMDEDCLMDDLRPLGEQETFLDVMA